MSRARPLHPDERRRQLVEATVPLLYLHGRSVTTKQVAEAAGVAEGTIFRVFESKDELVDQALQQAFAPGRLGLRVAEIDPHLGLADKVVQLVSILQQRYLATFELMRACGAISPPTATEERSQERRAVQLQMVALIEPDRELLRIDAETFVRTLHMLTFSASHKDLSENKPLTPVEITDLLLHGAWRRTDPLISGEQPC
ncbi:MAG: TetR/AcrR family transcriptional regulator [Nocardioides sp.]